MIDWVKRKIKWILITIGLMGIASVGIIGLTDTEISKIDNIKQAQEIYFNQYGKYQPIINDTTTIKDKALNVYTYLYPDGTQEYKIFTIWKEGNTTYKEQDGIKTIIRIDKLATTTPTL